MTHSNPPQNIVRRDAIGGDADNPDIQRVYVGIPDSVDQVVLTRMHALSHACQTVRFPLTEESNVVDDVLETAQKYETYLKIGRIS